VAVPSRRPADQVLPPRVADGLQGMLVYRAAFPMTSAGPRSGTSSGRAYPGRRP
jgi:hypothetical protein